MIAVDTNILVYAHRSDSPFHEEAINLLETLCVEKTRWAIPWPCFHEFISIATHPRIYDPPSTPRLAFDFLENWIKQPSVFLIGEGGSYLENLKELALSAKISGPKIHDARIAAICLSHGVSKLYTADRDFSSFPDLRCENPLVQ